MLQYASATLHVSHGFIFWWVSIVNNHLYADQEHHFTDQVKGKHLSVIQSSKGVSLSMWKALNILEKLWSVKHFCLVFLGREMLNGLLSQHFISLPLLAKSAHTKFIRLVRLFTFHVSLFFVNRMLCHADLVWGSQLCC